MSCFRPALRHFFFYLVGLCLFLAGLPTQAQTPHFRSHALPQNFASATINQLLQTRDHFIWIGTSQGLLRFDGTEYRHFALAPDSAQKVTALFQAKNGTLWVGFRNGHIGFLRNNKLLAFAPEEGLPNEPITGITEDMYGSLWFATYGEGLYVYRNKRLTNFNQEDDALPDDFAYTLTADSSGNIWAGTDGGIAICSFYQGKKKVTVLDAEDGLPDNIVTALNLQEKTATGTGRAYVGTESAGVCRFEFNSRKFTSLTPNWSYGPVTSLLLLRDRLWAGTPNQGIIEIVLLSDAVAPVSKQDRELPTKISTLLADNEGNIWAGGSAASLFLTNLSFTFQAENGLASGQNIQAVLQTKNDKIWYSTGNGLFLIEPRFTAANKPKNYAAGTALAGSNIISLYEDRNGHIWLGTFDRGVFILEPETGKLTQFTEANGLANNNVLSISGRGYGVWLATLGGVTACELPQNNRPENIKFSTYTSEHGLGSNYIYQVFVDSKGRVWFATDGKGVTLLENGIFRNFSLKQGLHSNVVYSITQTADRQIWISTASTGIYRFTGNGFEPAPPKNGLRDLNISSLIGDKNNNLLVVSPKGIDVYNTNSGVIFYHGKEAGISSIDPHLNAYSANTATGDVWIGSQSGLICYSSANNTLKAWPETRIHNLLVFLNEPENKANNSFAHDQNHISFNYTGFWYHDPAEVTYQVKLEGYDREWVNSRNRFITYPNLPPGNYTFKVKSSATGYFQGAPMAEYAFEIAAPFYKTPWFFGVMLLGAGGLLFSLVKYRESKLREAEQQKKEQIEFQFQTLKSQVNPHFLFNSFNTLIAVIEEDQETAVEYVEKLSDFYRNVLLHREDNLIPLREELDMIGTYYFLQTKRYKNNFQLNITVPDALLNWQIPPLTLQLLVENAVKHNIVSRDKPLTVTISADTKNSYLHVRNNLQVKQQHEPSTGTGLQNITGRYKLLTNKPVEIEKTADYYCVKLPLIPPTAS